MIVRQWSCEIKPEETKNYESFLREKIIPELEKIEGFQDASILRKLNSNDYMFISNWNSLEAIKEFAGDDVAVAVVTEEAQKMMLQFDKEVIHYQII